MRREDEMENQEVGKSRPKKGFSRRYETSAAHLEAQACWRAEHSAEAKRARAIGRQIESEPRSAEEQIAVLDRRLGVGQGAVRERAKLAALIDSK